MKILCFDASTHAGWALMEGQPGDLKPQIIESGLIENDKGVMAFGEYPWCYLDAADSIAIRLHELALRFKPDVIVVEETNLGRARYTQKILEFIHARLLGHLKLEQHEVKYLNTTEWRKVAGVTLSGVEKQNNNKIAKARKMAREAVKLDPTLKMTKALAAAKKKVGVKGKIGKKHVSVRYINELYDLDLGIGDNDTAEAICLGVAYFRGAATCDGDPSSQR